MDIRNFSTRNKAAPSDVFSYDDLASLCGGLDVRDVSCPLCGPSRRSPQNRKRTVLRVWNREPGFATYRCARCDHSGFAHQDGTPPIKPKQLQKMRKDASQRQRERTEKQQAKAQYLWHNRKPIEGSPAATYLRRARAYGGLLPATLGFLPPFRPGLHPAMITAFDIPHEPDPGVLRPQEFISGVQLTLLKTDGSGKADTEPDKIMVGPSNGWPIVLAPMNDALGLIVCEGIESGLSLYEATGCGVWVAGSAGRMPALANKVPDYTDCITVVGELDEAGWKGATELACRLKARGLHSELHFLGEQAVA